MIELLIAIQVNRCDEIIMNFFGKNAMKKLFTLTLSLLLFSVSIAVKSNSNIEKLDGLQGISLNYAFYNRDYFSQTIGTTPESVKRLVANRYGVTGKDYERFEISTFLKRDDLYLVNFTIKNSKEGALTVHSKMIRNYCSTLENKFGKKCKNEKRVYNVVPVALVKLETNEVISLPNGYFLGAGTKTNLARRQGEDLAPDHIIAMGSSSGNVFSKHTFGLPEGQTRRCLDGNFAFSDVNGDQQEELIVLNGKINDDIYDYKAPRNFGVNRVYMAVLDFASGEAVPIFFEELYSYEVDYRPYRQYKPIIGLYRDSKLFWGDFNKDGYADYLVRTRQNGLEVNFNLSSRSEKFFVPQTLQMETASMYLGSVDGSYSLYKTADQQDFLDFVAGVTVWEEGFPHPHNCDVSNR